MLAVVFTRLISTPLRSISQDMEKVGRLEIESGGTNGSMFKEIHAMDQNLQSMKGGLRSFASYVPKDLVRDLLKTGKEARLEGSTETLTILFTDIAGFTGISETMPADSSQKSVPALGVRAENRTAPSNLKNRHCCVNAELAGRVPRQQIMHCRLRRICAPAQERMFYPRSMIPLCR